MIETADSSLAAGCGLDSSDHSALGPPLKPEEGERQQGRHQATNDRRCPNLESEHALEDKAHDSATDYRAALGFFCQPDGTTA